MLSWLTPVSIIPRFYGGTASSPSTWLFPFSSRRLDSNKIYANRSGNRITKVERYKSMSLVNLCLLDKEKHHRGGCARGVACSINVNK